MQETTAAKGILTLIMAVFGYLYSSINALVIVLIIFIIMDYVLGMLACFKQDKVFDKNLAIWGAIKKVLYAFVLVLGFLADFILVYFSTAAGIALPFNALFGVAACAYLLGTEGSSIVKHLLVIGVPAPDILLKFFGLIKDQSGKIVDKGAGS